MSNAPSSAPPSPSPVPAPPIEVVGGVGGGGGGGGGGGADIIPTDPPAPHKLDDGGDGSPLPPALPPRPPPRPRGGSGHPGAAALAQLASADQLEQLAPGLEQQIRARVLRRSCWLRKYVFLCTACGGLAVLLGALFLTVYFMLRSYTSSLNYFETVPTYVPAAMLIVTGLIVMCLAGRRNRYGYLIKLCGGCCLACAILCVIVTITTTVIHMNRLQMLRECVYTRITQTCTCYPVPIESTHTGRAAADIVHYVFNSTPDCEVIHGALYSCLRAMFGLSVIGILVCIFSCMLIYQLLSHEKKKMYWEQLEMRCRYLYRQQRNPHHCTCCDECRYPPPHQLFPWEVMDDRRYWTPGRVGNLYSPNPGEDGGTGAMTLATQRLRGGQQQERTSGWSWRRLPWSRSGSSSNTAGTTSDHIHREGPSVHGYRHTTSSPDSQYGFSSHPTTGAPGAEVGTSPSSVPAHVVEGSPGPYGIPRDPHHHSTLTQARPSPPQMVGPFMTEGSVKAIQQQQPPPPPPPGAAYGQQYYLWGPPPPYSGNNSHCNSPAHRAGTGGTGEPILNLLHHPQGSTAANTGSPSRLQRYQHHHHMHHHHHHCQMNQQLAEQQNAGGVLVQGLMKNLQNRHLRAGGPISSAAARRFQQDQRQQTTRYDEFSSSSGDCVVVSDCGGMEKGSVVIENYVNTGGEATMAGLNTSSVPGGDESTSATTIPSTGEGNSSGNVAMTPSDSSSLVTGNKDSNNRTSNNTLPASARKVKKRVEMPKTLGNIPQNFSSEQQIPGSGGSQKSSPSHFPVGSGSTNNSYPSRANVPMMFSAHQPSQQQQPQQQQQQSCQMQEHYHHPHHPHNNTEMSGDDEEETRLVADKYPHSLPTSSAVVRGKDGGAVNIAVMGNTGNTGGNGTGGNIQGYHGHHHQTMQGVSNAGFQGQEEDDDEEEGHQHPHHHHHPSQMMCGSKSEPTESEVYFADVSSCCNVSVRNDGQDSSLYDEALDPQKHRLVMLGQSEQGGHLQRLPEAYQMSEKVPTHHHHHNSGRRFLPHQQGEVIVGMPPASHHQYHQHQTDLSSDHHHLTVSDEDNEEQLTSNCFSYQRQTSTRTRLPFPLPTHHHHLSEQDSSTVEEDLPEGLMGGHGMVVGGGNGNSGRDFIDAENVRKGIGTNTRLSESSKDLSQQQATPTDNIDAGGYLMSSPMSISASSPGSFPTGTSDDLDNCGSYYDNHHGTVGNNNNSSDVGSSSGSTSAVCSPLSNDTSSNIVMFGSPSSGHGYPIPSPQKVQYDQQGNRLLHHQHLHQQCGGNNNYHPNSPSHEQTTDFSHHHHQVHHPGGDQHFLAPDAQYETIPHHQPSQNTATTPQGYHPSRHLQNFSAVTQRSDDYNGNTPSNSPGKGAGNRGPPGGPVGITSPARRRLNLPLHHVTAGPLNNNAGGNLVESLYHTATSTEEDESESHQPQSSSYSDATMDSGCHSGSEFAARRQRGSNRGKDPQQRTGVNTRTQVKDEERSLVEEVVPAMRSVNV